MLLNRDVALVGDVAVLVPYRRQHVGTYHGWMQDERLLEATASERLSLQEEYDMQRSWRDDPDKCTFIVLAREDCVAGPDDVAVVDDDIDEPRRPNETMPQPPPAVDDGAGARCSAGSDDNDDDEGTPPNGDDGVVVPRLGADDDFVEENLGAMAGDVNLFLSLVDREDGDDADGEGRRGPTSTPPRGGGSSASEVQAEVDIMIAEERYRGRGLGFEATCLAMLWGANRLNVTRYFCKISETNDASLSLFERKLGFSKCGYAACFGEVEMELRAASTEEMVQAITDLLLAFRRRRGGDGGGGGGGDATASADETTTPVVEPVVREFRIGS